MEWVALGVIIFCAVCWGLWSWKPIEKSKKKPKIVLKK